MEEASKHEVTGIVLAGGMSRRMGADKGLILIDEIEMTLSSIKLLKPFCSEILISANQPDYGKWGYQVVPDIHQGKGPMAGIHACMNASPATYFLVLSCDLPFMAPEVIRRLLGQIGTSDAIVPSHGNKIEPLSAIYHRRALAIIEEHLSSDDLAVRGILKHLQTDFVDMSDLVETLPYHPFFNVNTLKDLDLARSFIHNKSKD